MDVLKFLQGGNQTPNPKYNPKTKKGATQPPVLVDYNPGTSVSDLGRGRLFSRISGQSYNLNQYDIDKYAPYDVYVNPVDDPEKLDKERAVNQSNWEQGLRMIGQIGNEITVGTAIGFADLADAFYNMVSNSPNDYQSEISSELESLKESINERLAIYRENPNTAFDIGDFAWWASNAPSIASSLTLMVPSAGLAKGVSLLGKGIKFNKLANKIANAINMTQKSRAITGRIAEATAIGVPSRYLENYQEARQTYNDIEDYSKTQLANMNDKQREEFYNNNPKYRDMSDEEVAKDIAKNSADVTFAEDWANVLFDVWQVYSLKNLWKNALSGNTTSSRLRNLNTAFNSNIDDAAAITNALSNKTTKQAITSTLKDIGDDILHGVRAEWTEGVEEAINYIASQDGLYNGKKVFDKDIPQQTIKDYLQDPMLWEQAFWGALGGVVFSGVMNKAGEFINKRLDKDWTSAEKQRENEILGRTATFQAYQERLNSIANGKNPFITTTNENGNQVNPDIVAGTEEELRSIAEKEYMDNIIINSMNAGNLGLLESSINSKEFNDSITNKLGLQQQDSNELINRFKTEINNLKNEYNTTLNKVNRLGGGFEVGRIIATQMVHARNRQENYNNLLNWANDVLNQDITNNHIENVDITSAKNGIYQHIINSIQRDIKTIQDNAAINNSVKQERIAQLNERLDAINKLYTPIDIENKNDIQSAIQLQKQYNEVFKDLAEVVNAEINVEVNKNQLNLSDDNIKSRITYLNNFFDNSRKKIVNKAMDDLRNAYKQYGKEYVNSVIKDANNGNKPNINKVIRDAYAALDLSSKGNEHLKNTIEQLAEIAEIENDVNNTPKEEEVAPVNPDVNEVNETDVDDTSSSSSSTGSIAERSGAVPSEPTNAEQPQSQTGQSVSQGTISTPKPEVTNVLPDDEFERGQIGTDLVYESIADLEDSLGHESTSSDLLNARQSIIDKLSQAGFEQTEASDIVNNIIDGLTGGSLYSSVQDDSTRRLLLNATYATITGNERNIEAIMDDFANSVDSEGNTRGKIVNGKVYLSIGQLVEYIDSVTGNKIIKNYLFNQIKNYLYNSTNNQGKYRATDESTIKKLNARQFVQYVDNIAKERLERLQTENTNNVNLGYIVDNENVKAFTSIKQGDYLDAEYDNKTKRINILTNGTIVGYIGVPNIDKFGNYDMVNQGWKYNIHVENGQVVSPLKDALISILNGDRFDEEFISHLYEFAVRDEITSDELTDLYNELINKYPDINNDFLVGSPTDISKHLINITRYIFNQPYENNHEASINRWFNNLLNSYDQATTIVKGDFKGKIKAVNVKYGILNTIDDANGDWNDIQETVVNYDENTNKLGVVVQGQVYLNGESKPTIIENLTTNGMPVISIPNSDGTSLYAFCKQVPLNSNLLKGDAKNIVNSIKNEVTNLCNDYMIGKITFSELKQNLGDIFGNNKLINGDRNIGLQITINPTNIGFYVKGAHFNGKDYAFTINSDAGNYKRNIIINSPHIVNNNFKIGKNYGINSNNIEELHNALRPVVDEMFNYAQFAISKDFINDNTKTNDKTNKYIYRENGKTIINIDGETYSYNSYQDFIISNGLIRTKLANTNTDDTAGNWKVDIHSHLDIAYELEGRPPVEDGVIPEQLSEFMLDDTVNAININSFESALTANNLTRGLKKYFANDQTAIDYIDALQKLNILPKNVQIVDSLTDNNGNQVNAVYHRNTDTIELSSSAIAGQRVYRVVNIIVHESLHRQLYTKYNTEQAIALVKPIYDKFKTWLDTQDDSTKERLKPYLFESFDTAEALEEFLVESITSNALMSTLNEIKDDNRKTSKRKTLFSRLLEVIADMLGIKINEDSLLAAARDAYKAIKKMPKESNQEAIQGTFQFEEETASTEQTENPNEDNSQDYNYNNDNLNDGLDMFSSVDDNMVSNMAELTSRLPIDQQPEFVTLLDTGRISFSCM
jgi:hypothetical protein